MNLPFTEASPASDNDETNVAAPETGSETDVSSQDANAPAESSAADSTDAKQEPESLLSVIKDVVEKPEGTEDSSTTEGKQEEGQKAEGEAEAKPEGEGQSDADVPFHNHPRWKEMIRERDELRGDSQNYRTITDFMQNAHLSGEEVAEGFEIMALLKSGTPEDLTKALEWFEPRVRSLREAVGTALPDDLQQKVADGVMDEEAAKELAKARYQNQHFQARTTEREKQDETQRTQKEALAHAERVATAVSQWEQGMKAKDPDYAAKAKLVETQSLAIIAREGRPQTPEQAVELVARAYGEVGEMMKSFAPKLKAMKPAPAGLSARATTEPKSLRDAVSAALNR